MGNLFGKRKVKENNGQPRSNNNQPANCKKINSNTVVTELPPLNENFKNFVADLITYIFSIYAAERHLEIFPKLGNLDFPNLKKKLMTINFADTVFAMNIKESLKWIADDTGFPSNITCDKVLSKGDVRKINIFMKNYNIKDLFNLLKTKYVKKYNSLKDKLRLNFYDFIKLNNHILKNAGMNPEIVDSFSGNEYLEGERKKIANRIKVLNNPVASKIPGIVQTKPKEGPGTIAFREKTRNLPQKNQDIQARMRARNKAISEGLENIFKDQYSPPFIRKEKNQVTSNVKPVPPTVAPQAYRPVPSFSRTMPPAPKIKPLDLPQISVKFPQTAGKSKKIFKKN